MLDQALDLLVELALCAWPEVAVVFLHALGEVVGAALVRGEEAKDGKRGRRQRARLAHSPKGSIMLPMGVTSQVSMTDASRRLYRHGFIILFIAFLIGGVA